ncbi:hypothetical protein [Bacillus mycoides]|uniref:hypothetical protein n=1 Tax=Bacillus mycoides TaxID=1405 RepID=UPI0011A04D6B|nr:hypothetical protein [Bacillus mycoides]
MKKHKKLVISISLIGILIIGVTILGKPFFSFTNTQKKTESFGSKLTFEEELAYSKTINPNIKNSEVHSLRKQRNQLDELHKKLDKLELDYGIHPNKELKGHTDERTAEKSKNHLELLTEIWYGEMRFLDARYKAGLIEKDMYKEDKSILEELKKKYIE